MPQDAANPALQIFQQAEALLAAGREAESVPFFEALANAGSGFSWFRLGEIYNRAGRPDEALACHRRAYEVMPNLAALLVAEQHPLRGYVYAPVEEVDITHCPLCGGAGVSHSAYNCVVNSDFNPRFSPLRLWRRCDACDHLFAAGYPVRMDEALKDHHLPMIPNPVRYAGISHAISRLVPFVSDFSLLEIGPGAGEFGAVAQEMGFDVTGLELRRDWAAQITAIFGYPVEVGNFSTWSPGERRFGVVAMGDVLEHLADPTEALVKAREVLTADGVMWLSTPNFRSAHSLTVRTLDPMWRVAEHLNYFSRRSLAGLLDRLGFDLVSYGVSDYYRGSMEVVAKRRPSP